MKKTFIATLCSCITMLTSCQKDSNPVTEKSTKEKIYGKWMLVTYNEETYDATNNLICNNNRIGDKSDSLIFKQNGKLYTYSDTDGSHIDDYEVLNDQSIRIEMEQWKIVKLTDTEFNLVTEETDPVTKEKDMVKASLKRQ
jgi:hypothetical protein